MVSILKLLFLFTFYFAASKDFISILRIGFLKISQGVGVFFNKVTDAACSFTKNQTPAQTFSCEFYKNFKYIFFTSERLVRQLLEKFSVRNSTHLYLSHKLSLYKISYSLYNALQFESKCCLNLYYYVFINSSYITSGWKRNNKTVIKTS